MYTPGDTRGHVLSACHPFFNPRPAQSRMFPRVCRYSIRSRSALVRSPGTSVEGGVQARFVLVARCTRQGTHIRSVPHQHARSHMYAYVFRAGRLAGGLNCYGVRAPVRHMSPSETLQCPVDIIINAKPSHGLSLPTYLPTYLPTELVQR